MSQDYPPEKESTSILSKAGTVMPAFLIFASGLYVLGLYAAFRMDTSLGVGSLLVSRERAVSLGIVQLLVLSPVCLFWMSVRETVKDCSEEKLLYRLKAVLLCAILPSLWILMLVVLFIQVFGVTETSPLILSSSIPVVLVALLLLNSPSNARRLVVAWPLFLALTAPIPAATLSSWLPYSFGGHLGPDVVVRMKDTTTHHGRLMASDSSVLVIFSETKNLALSRSEILAIESVPRKK